MSLFETQTSREILIYQFRVYTIPKVVLEPTYNKEFKFLADPQSYNEKFESGEALKDLPKGLKARPLSQRDIETNIFWEHYKEIGSTQPRPFTPWDRQEPVRLYIPMQFVPNDNKIPGTKMYAYPPEVFLFPSGWASLLKFSLHGSIPNSQLPQLIRDLSHDPWISEAHSKGVHMNRDQLVNQVEGIVKKYVYEGSSLVKNKPLKNRLVAILDREDPKPHKEQYSDEGEAIVYGVILGRGVSFEESVELQYEFIPIRYKKFRYHYKGWGVEGWVYFRYQSGFFLDLPIITTGNQELYQKGKRFVQCLATNLRNMVIMVNLLQTLIHKGHSSVPTSSDEINSIIKRGKGDQYRNFCQLMKSAQMVLDEIHSLNNSPVEGERIGKAYVENNKWVKGALESNIPVPQWS